MSLNSRLGRLEGMAHTGEESAKSQALQEAEEAFRREIASCSLEENEGLLAVLEDLEAQQIRGVEHPEASVPEWLQPRWERHCELWEAVEKSKAGGWQKAQAKGSTRHFTGSAALACHTRRSPSLPR